jgi:4-oxalocrotonate tautomerase
MPVIRVNLIEGRSDEQIEAMIREVTDVVSVTLDAPRESIRIIVNTTQAAFTGSGSGTIPPPLRRIRS